MNMKQAIDLFFNSFRTNHVILYIGQNAKNDDIRECISKYPWSGIVTSKKDPELASFFNNEERVSFDLSDRSEIPIKPLARKKLPIMRLLGVQGDAVEDEDLAWLNVGLNDGGFSEIDKHRAIDMLKMLPSLLDHVNPLVVIGANSDIDWWLFANCFLQILYKDTTNGTVTIWDMPDEVDEKYSNVFAALKRAATEKEFGFFSASLVDILREQDDEEDDEYAILPEIEDDVYYQAKRSISFSSREALLLKNIGTLLTERTINKIQPLGRVMSKKWYSNFLETSSTLGPQWYGYLPKSDFHVKRSFEEPLVHLVQNMLEGCGVDGNPVQNRPIVLAGAPGSSKSVTLAALAYQIYIKRINPVIFISKDAFLSTNIGTSFDELDEAMQMLEKKSEVDTRILVIWDSSAYKTGIDRAKSLLKQLWNRGRRFVLVCSSYDMHAYSEGEGNKYCYNKETGKFEETVDSIAQVFDAVGCYFVKAVRTLNESEKAQFWDQVREYSGINKDTISKFRKKLADENRNEVFDYYYLLISVLRENLELGLRSEQSKVYPYVEKELARAIGEIKSDVRRDKKNTPMYQAFLSAGIDVSEYVREETAIEKEESAESAALNKKLDDLNLCVALFSRFKLAVSYGLAYTILVGEDKTEQYSESTRDLYRIVTNEIPWLYYGEDGNGDFTFRFRNPLEAEIFLQNHDFAGEQQIGLLCRIIDIYGMDYRRSRCKDLSFTDNLQTLLRMMGPNTGYVPFRTTHQHEHQCILQKLDMLIEKLVELREDYGVPDEDAGFASIIVTFIREFYGSIWTRIYAPSSHTEEERWESDELHYSLENYEKRIQKMISAIALAESSVEEIEYRENTQNISVQERQHLNNQRNLLAVEIAQCNMRLEDLVGEYKHYCSCFGYEENKEIANTKLRYQTLYRQLIPVISNAPTNGYAYNTLFKAFIKTYEKVHLSEVTRLQYLSEIMQVVETCETVNSEIINRGSHGDDELTRRINQIKDLSVDHEITLDLILQHRKGIQATNDREQICFDLFDEMLEANNAAAITFVCQKELRLPKNTRHIDDEQFRRCQKVYNFMKEADNFECVCANAYALAMLIRVSWMLFNRTILSNSPECQLTKLKRSEWLEINKLCRLYDALADENKQPIILLVYALSELQVSNLTENGYNMALDILGKINEGLFYQRRMWTPFMICGEDGYPVKYTGTVLKTKENNGFIRVNNVPLQLKGSTGVRFRQYNLGRKTKMPEINQVLSGLELGIGYTGFSAYSEEGRKEREARS